MIATSMQSQNYIRIIHITNALTPRAEATTSVSPTTHHAMRCHTTPCQSALNGHREQRAYDINNRVVALYSGMWPAQMLAMWTHKFMRFVLSAEAQKRRRRPFNHVMCAPCTSTRAHPKNDNIYQVQGGIQILKLPSSGCRCSCTGEWFDSSAAACAFTLAHMSCMRITRQDIYSNLCGLVGWSTHAASLHLRRMNLPVFGLRSVPRAKGTHENVSRWEDVFCDAVIELCTMFLQHFKAIYMGVCARIVNIHRERNNASACARTTFPSRWGTNGNKIHTRKQFQCARILHSYV